MASQMSYTCSMTGIPYDPVPDIQPSVFLWLNLVILIPCTSPSLTQSVPWKFDGWVLICSSLRHSLLLLFKCPGNQQGEIWNFPFQWVKYLLESLVFLLGASILTEDTLLSLLIILLPWNCFVYPQNMVFLHTFPLPECSSFSFSPSGFQCLLLILSVISQKAVPDLPNYIKLK